MIVVVIIIFNNNGFVPLLASESLLLPSVGGAVDGDTVCNGGGVGDANDGSYSHNLNNVSAGSESNETDTFVIISNSLYVNNDDGKTSSLT